MNALSRRDFFKGLGALSALSLLGRNTWAADGQRPPNIIFILADDYGLDGVGCYGSGRYKTPHLDALAQSGLRFETCYSTPLCGPTRCQLITGRYPFRTGGLTNQSANNPQSKDEPSVAKILKAAGYATGHAGKWRQMGESPGAWGFDEFITDPTASGWFWQKSYTKNGQAVALDQEAYYPDICHDFAVDFIQRHKDKPFFFYYASHLVHAPILKTPDTKDGANLYADNVTYLDQQVGKLIAELDRLKLRENTVVIFSGDNGTARQSGAIHGRQIHGAKGSMLEGGSRVPLIASWPGTMPAGKVCADRVDFSDLLPTFADLAGAQLPAGVTFDGTSFAPQLRGQAGQPRDWIFVQLGQQWYVRNRQWKLTQAGELYDMTDAPFAEKPVPAGEQPEARQQLQAVLDQLKPGAGKTAEPGAPRKGRKRRK